MNNELNSALYALAVLLEPSNSSQCSTPANGCHENSDPENSDLRPLTPKTQTANPENSDLSKFKSVLILSFWGLRSEVWVFVTPQTNEELNNLVQVQLWICTELAQETHLSKPKVKLYNKIYPCASTYRETCLSLYETGRLSPTTKSWDLRGLNFWKHAWYSSLILLAPMRLPIQTKLLQLQ